MRRCVCVGYRSHKANIMVGGIIEDFFIKEIKGKFYTIKFLVKDNADYCIVMAEVPKPAIDHKMIKSGQPIWWQTPSVLITIEETQDVTFKKIGFSSSNKQSFFEDKDKCKRCA